MKLVILDGFTLYENEMMKDMFSDLGDVVCYDRTKPEDVYRRICDAEMVLTNKVILTNDMLEKCPNLVYVGVMATGYNVIDTAFAARKNIVVTNIPAYSTSSVVQHVFALILSFASKIAEHDSAVKNGKWASSSDFTFLEEPIFELSGKTIGVIGMGAIGESVCRVASAFDMKILAYSRHEKDVCVDKLTWCDLPTLYRQSDFITIHAPLNDETRGMINKNSLSLMKESAFLVNTSRGPVICEEDLADALNHGRIAAAAVDVLSTEPPKADNPLLTAKNITITPHIAWATNEAKKRLIFICHENIKSFLNGNPQNQVH
jgi:Lactate dehydrogenase and related dehydrogenases